MQKRQTQQNSRPSFLWDIIKKPGLLCPMWWCAAFQSWEINIVQNSQLFQYFIFSLRLFEGLAPFCWRWSQTYERSFKRQVIPVSRSLETFNCDYCQANWTILLFVRSTHKKTLWVWCALYAHQTWICLVNWTWIAKHREEAGLLWDRDHRKGWTRLWLDWA